MKIKFRYFLPYGLVRYLDTKKYDKYFQLCSRILKNNCFQNSDSQRSKIIWTNWLQGKDEMPLLCKRCLQSVEQFMPNDYKVICIDENNEQDYIKVDPNIKKKFKSGIIKAPHYSDYLRLELLIKYGGIWVDPTVLFTDNIPENVLGCELFLFKGSNFDCLRNDNIGPNVSSWFIISNKNNPYLIALRNALVEYWKHYNKAFSYYMFHFLFSIIGKIKPDWWDSIPYYPNVLPHYMFFKILDEPFDNQKYTNAKKYCFCHKLTYQYNVVDNSLKDLLYKNKI